MGNCAEVMEGRERKEEELLTLNKLSGVSILWLLGENVGESKSGETSFKSKSLAHKYDLLECMGVEGEGEERGSKGLRLQVWKERERKFELNVREKGATPLSDREGKARKAECMNYETAAKCFEELERTMKDRASRWEEKKRREKG